MRASSQVLIALARVAGSYSRSRTGYNGDAASNRDTASSERLHGGLVGKVILDRRYHANVLHVRRGAVAVGDGKLALLGGFDLAERAV